MESRDEQSLVYWYLSKLPLSNGRLDSPYVSKIHEWERLSVEDSRSLEILYQKNERAILRRWWELDFSPNVTPREKVEHTLALVCDGLFEVDVMERNCVPAFWESNEKPRRILRGFWLVERDRPLALPLEQGRELLPLREDLQDAMSMAYNSKVWNLQPASPRSHDQPKQCTSRVDLHTATADLRNAEQKLQWINNRNPYYALFYSEEEIWFCPPDDIGVQITKALSNSWQSSNATDTSTSSENERRNSHTRIPPGALRVHRGWPHFAAEGCSAGMVSCDTQSLENRQGIEHLVLVVHGIGQAAFTFGEIVEETKNLRKGVQAALNEIESNNNSIIKDTGSKISSKNTKKDPSLACSVEDHANNGKIMVLPIQWRKKLNLRTDHGIETITQPSMPGVFKNITNLTVDLLWYFTPEFRQAIVDVLTDELNKTVNKIRQFFPKFDDSRKGYGAPGIITQVGRMSTLRAEHVKNRIELRIRSIEKEAEILRKQLEVYRRKDDDSCLSQPRSSPMKRQSEMLSDDNSLQSLEPLVDYKPLEFSVDTFFAIGSPVSLFLMLRGSRISEELPLCHRFYNVNHPFDPVGFRIEPLIHNHLAKRKPAYVPYHRGGKRLHIEFQESVEGFSNQLATKSREIQANVSTHVESVRHQLFSAVSFFFRKPEQPATGGKPEQSSDLVENKKLSPDVLAFAAASGNAGLKTLEEATKGVSVESSKEIETVLEALTGRPNGQVDWVLQEAPMENQYISSVVAHFSYWRDPDFALFLVQKLKDVPVSRDSMVELDGDTP